MQMHREGAGFPQQRGAGRNSLVIGLTAAFLAASAGAQSLKVIPVNIQMPSGQRTATLTVINEGTTETAIQIRTYAWSQPDGDDKLTPSDEVLTSPPLATIPAGGTQVVRLVLRHSPTGREATYRIILNQIPAASIPGVVQIVLSMSIPIFAQPATRPVPHLMFHIERDAGKAYLVGLNDGVLHDAVRDIVLSTSDGRKLMTASNASPYILSGVTRRWAIAANGPLPIPSETLRMTARGGAGTIERQVQVVKSP